MTNKGVEGGQDRRPAIRVAQEPGGEKKLAVGKLLDFNSGAPWELVSTGNNGLLRFSVGHDVLGFARALGRQWKSLEDLRAGHTSEQRDTKSGIARMEDNGAASRSGERWVQIGASPIYTAPGQQDRRFDTGILIETQSGYWEPARVLLASDGQEISLAQKPRKQAHASVVEGYIEERAKTVGREKAELATTSPDYDLVRGTFMPNWASSQVTGGGVAELTYFWDRTSGELTLAHVGTRDLRGATGLDPEYAVHEGNDVNFDIRPFGIFAAPATIDEATLAYNVNYPSRIPLFDPHNGGLPDESTPKRDLSYNLFGIRQTKAMSELGGK